MADLIKELVEQDGIIGLAGFTDMGVEEGEYPSEYTIWDIESPAEGEWLNVRPNVVAVHVASEASSYVRYELWDGPPPIDPSWPRSWEGELFLASGRICAASLVPAFAEHDYHAVFDLGAAATNWPIRIYSKSPEDHPEPGFPRIVGGPVLFKLQFWPPDSGSSA